MRLSDIVERIKDTYDANKVSEDFDVTMITDFEKAKDWLCFRLVNAEKNKDLLQAAPYIPVCGDLAIVFFVLLSSDKEKTATVTLRHTMSDPWGMSAEELFEIARSNTERLFHAFFASMAEVLKGILGDQSDDIFFDMPGNALPMYVLSNESKMNGAGALFYRGLLKEVSDRIGEDLIILPSSVHETIIIPVSEKMHAEDLKAMVTEINATTVAPEDRLSDNVYIYCRETDEITLA